MEGRAGLGALGALPLWKVKGLWYVPWVTGYGSGVPCEEGIAWGDAFLGSPAAARW